MIALRLLAMFGVVAAAAPGVAQAQQCQAVVLRPLTDDLGNTWKPGDKLPVDIERDNSAGGSYCAHGGSCVPRSINGVAAVRLFSCHVGPSIGGTDHRLVHGAAPRPRG